VGCFGKKIIFNLQIMKMDFLGRRIALICLGIQVVLVRFYIAISVLKSGIGKRYIRDRLKQYLENLQRDAAKDVYFDIGMGKYDWYGQV